MHLETKLEEMYVRSYLLQRAELLNQKFKVLEQFQIPDIVAQQFGITVLLPKLIEEPCVEKWRLASPRKRTNSEIPIDSSLFNQPSYGLPFKCEWDFDDEEVTITEGYKSVPRTISDLSLLNDWREIYAANGQPKSVLDECIQSFNTVNLDLLTYQIPQITEPNPTLQCETTKGSPKASEISDCNKDVKVNRLIHGDFAYFNQMFVRAVSIAQSPSELSSDDVMIKTTAAVNEDNRCIFHSASVQSCDKEEEVRFISKNMAFSQRKIYNEIFCSESLFI